MVVAELKFKLRVCKHREDDLEHEQLTPANADLTAAGWGGERRRYPS